MSETSEIESNKTEKDYLELGDCFKEIVQQNNLLLYCNPVDP